MVVCEFAQIICVLNATRRPLKYDALRVIRAVLGQLMRKQTWPVPVFTVNMDTRKWYDF